MKQLTFVILLVLLAKFTFGQTSIPKDGLLFEQGLLLQQLAQNELDLDKLIDSKDSTKIELATDIKETILDKALAYYQELVDDFPNSKLLYRALNNKGAIELELDDKEEAKNTFLRILFSKANDNEKGGVGSGLMAEPYANYKNRAAKVLANMCIEDNNFKEAIQYLDLTKKYPYQHFCGNEYAANNIYMCQQYAKCYIGLGDTQMALTFLLPNIIDDGLADNSKLVELAYNTLLGTYPKEELKTRYEQAFKNYQTVKIKSKREEYELYSINFLDTKIEFSSFFLYFMNPDEKQKGIENIYKQSKFYKLLND